MIPIHRNHSSARSKTLEWFLFTGITGVSETTLEEFLFTGITDVSEAKL